VITCSNAQEALDRFSQGGVDLVLTDFIMPNVDGVWLVEQVKKLSPDTPTVLFSGKIKNFERNTPADVFLPKGMYAPAELLERIRILLVRKRGPKRSNHSPEPAVTTAG
jgi:DNA-binding response OmpR family regulator